MNSAARVLVFQVSDNWGGIESFIRDAIVPLSKHGYDITLVAAPGSGRLLERFPLPASSFVRLGSFRHPVAYLTRLRAALTNGYDIVHFNKNSATNIVAIVLVKLMSDAKILVHSHNTRAWHDSLLTRVLHRVNRPLVNALADGKAACSELAAKHLFGEGSARDCLIIRNGIDVPRFAFSGAVRARERERLGISPDELLMGNVGRYTAQKNQRFLLKLIAQMKGRGRRAKLLVVGEGELGDELKAYVRSLGVSDRVMFCAGRESIPALYMAMDVFVMPSLFEGLPITCVEAQAAGLPIVASDTISSEIDLTGRVRFLSLDAGLESWASEVRAAASGEFDRDLGARLVSQRGFSRDQSTRQLADMYESLV